jgi:hypothetical protein
VDDASRALVAAYGPPYLWVNAPERAEVDAASQHDAPKGRQGRGERRVIE